jgi:beta-glucanase (GH16 family)
MSNDQPSIDSIASERATSEPAAKTSSLGANVSKAHRRRSTKGSIALGRRRFISYRLRAPYEKPWLNDSRWYRATRHNNWILYAWALAGLVGAGLVAYFAYIAPSRPRALCLVYSDNFGGSSLNASAWTHEIALNGFGTGSFDWTTSDSSNAFVDSNGLHIVPTLTNETTSISNAQLIDGYTLNLTADGTCSESSSQTAYCVATSNATQGIMIPPVRSARLTTQNKVGIRYGRVEVEAQLPVGDWLWPAIWMMSTQSVYGAWPRSGEIDIMESRGNLPSYPPGGPNWYTSTLHWGPASTMDGAYRTSNSYTLQRGDYTERMHTYGLEWDARYIYTYLDTRLTQVTYAAFDAGNTLWDRGQFGNAGSLPNGTMLTNPWVNSTSTTGNAPFDQEFFLILNVAVGSRSGWFPDGVGDKPWADDDVDAERRFWNDVQTWLPTWGEGTSRGMTVRSVRMWQDGACTIAT